MNNKEVLKDLFDLYVDFKLLEKQFLKTNIERLNKSDKAEYLKGLNLVTEAQKSLMLKIRSKLEDEAPTSELDLIINPVNHERNE